jgi:hypothetical protein
MSSSSAWPPVQMSTSSRIAVSAVKEASVRLQLKPRLANVKTVRVD